MHNPPLAFPLKRIPISDDSSLFLSWPPFTFVASDPCTALKPEEISKVLGETFGQPVRQEVPADRLAGEAIICVYKSKSLTFTISSSYAYVSADSHAELGGAACS